MNLDYILEYAGDFFKETVGLTLEEKGLRATLRFIACDQDPVGTLPVDDVELARLANISTKKLAALKPHALKGWMCQGERLVHEGLRKQYASALEQKAKRSRAGKAGNAARWHGGESVPNGSQCDPYAIRLGSPSSSSSSNLIKKEKTKTAHRSDVLNGCRLNFEIFWRSYPKKRGKGQAEKVWAKFQPDDVLLGTMLAKIEQAKLTQDWQKENGQFIPHPATWLTGRRWEDEFPVNGHGPTHTCTKRVQGPGEQFIHDCGQPASPESPLTKPRCAEHLRQATQPKELVDVSH